MSILADAFAWLTDGVNWSGEGGIPVRVLEHLRISGISLVAAALVALPAGMYIGHSRRWEIAVLNISNLGRAIPSFAILALAFPLSLQLGLGLSIWPAVAALFLLAIPPILTNTYVGVRGVDADTLEAARAMSMSGREILRSIETPLAAPLIVAGLRISAVQVVATATLAALVAGGGLGRFIVDGFAQGDDAMVLGGAFVVAVLAVLTEVAFGVVERMTAPPHARRGLFAARTRPDEIGPGQPGASAGL